LRFIVALCRRIVIVMPAIKLDDQFLRGTKEVHDIGTNRRLSPEVRAFHGQLFQCPPQYAFVRRRVRPQFPCRRSADCFRNHDQLARGEITPPRV
jgi:hypothetical protein